MSVKRFELLLRSSWMWHLTATRIHTLNWYHLIQPVTHIDHLWTTNQNTDIIFGFLLLSAQIRPSIINKEKKYDGGGGLVCRDQGFSREAKIQLEVFLSLLPCLPLSSLRWKEKSNYRAPKDLIIGWGSFACVRAAQQEPTRGQPFCARCEPLCHCTLATFRNIQIERLALLTHPLSVEQIIAWISKNRKQLLQFLKW